MPDRAASEPLYREVLQSIYSQTLSDLSNHRQLKVFISGGRGLGKTFLLQELARSRSQDTRVENRIIEGSKGADAIREIAASYESFKHWQEGKKKQLPGDLLVDDLDRLIVSVGTQEPSVFEGLMNNLLALISGLPEENRFCAFTSLFHAARLAELLELTESRQKWNLKTSIAVRAFSGLMQLYEKVQLNPWPDEWEKRIRVLVRVHLPRLSPAVQDLCTLLLAKLTGGHPALLVPAISQLAILAEARKIPEVAAPELAEYLEIVIEDAAYERGIGALRRGLNSLRDAESKEWQKAYEDLRQLAQGRIAAPPMRSREILRDEGLIYQDPVTLRSIIPGKILRGELMLEPAGPLQMEIKPDPQAPDKHGYLKVWDRHQERQIPVSGGSWSVLKLIFDEPKRIISLDEICERTHLTTKNAVRSAIQRLIGDARKSGVDKILDNLYGKGYRKGESPEWLNAT